MDTTTTPPAAGQVLKWDAPDSKWKPATDSAGSGGIALTDLSLTQAAATGTGTLTYNNTTGEFVYTPPDLSGFLTSETITLATLKTEVAASADFADFQTRIAAL